LLFFLSVGLGKTAADLLAYMNDKQASKSLAEWFGFGITAPLAALAWKLLWLWFKTAERQCVELISEH
jgi:uncharacterized membrane protein YebE (DUF533 family)